MAIAVLKVPPTKPCRLPDSHSDTAEASTCELNLYPTRFSKYCICDFMMDVSFSELSNALLILFPNISKAPEIGNSIMKKDITISKLAESTGFHPLSTNFFIGFFNNTNNVIVPSTPEKQGAISNMINPPINEIKRRIKIWRIIFGWIYFINLFKLKSLYQWFLKAPMSSFFDILERPSIPIILAFLYSSCLVHSS